MYNKKILPLIVFVSVAVGFLIGRYVYFSKNIFFRYNTGFQKVEKIIYLIEKNYEDKFDVFDFIRESLLEKISDIDPYSHYINSDNKADYEIKDSYVGFGIQYSIFRDTVTILQTFDNSPALAQDIKPLDKIISINDINATKLTIDSVKEIFNDKAELNLEVLDFFTQKIRTVKLEKSEILVPSVSGMMLDEQVGYIEITQFSDRTYELFEQKSKKLLKNGLKSLILDLRDNKGGTMLGALNITREFFSSEDTLVVIETNDKEQNVIMLEKGGLLAETEVVVLINSYTASASELLCLTLQDYDRALLIGMPSFGKGVFQQDISILEGDFLKITTGKYFGPSGRWINRSNDEKKYYKTKHGRSVISNAGIMPEIVTFSEALSFVDFGMVAVDVINYHKDLFIQNPQNYEQIISNITDTIEFPFATDKENFENSMRKFFVPKDEFLKIKMQNDILIEKAMDIIEENSIEKYIYEKDTLE